MPRGTVRLGIAHVPRVFIYLFIHYSQPTSIILIYFIGSRFTIIIIISFSFHLVFHIHYNYFDISSFTIHYSLFHLFTTMSL